jgi:methyltransferase-like protein 6
MPLERLDVHERSITNRSRELTMDRRWVQASFASATTPGAPLPPPPPPPEPAWMARKRLIAEKAERAKKAEEEDAAAAGEDETSTDAAS